MKILLLVIFLVLFLETVSAEVVFTEVMYDPIQASDTDAEWVEIYNNGSENVNLSLWKIDNSNFDDFSISPGEFVVIARELIDGTDIDNDSFESIYGNNDGLWNNLDGNYRAFSGTFSLTDNDEINLSNGTYSEIFAYNSSFGGNGNGYTIEKIDVNKGNLFENWRQGSVSGGTPGYGTVARQGTKNIGVLVEVTGGRNLLSLVNITDDANDIGIQVIPEINKNKSVYINVFVNGSNINDITRVVAELNGTKFDLLRNYDIDNFSSVYSGSILLNYYDKPGVYTANISVINRFNFSSSILVNFEYLGLLAISLDKTAVNFGKLEPGKLSDTEIIKVINNGNVGVDLELYGADLESGENKISISNLEYGFSNFSDKLDYRPILFDFNLLTGIDANKDLLLRLNLPLITKPSVYAGSISLVGVVG
ncbi:lamin tail domain-containing protein [Candidatus Woesearchaeota archaeon]|nr:lamin tail domain-containing protein [Candidatus Woesearchaeota archaeon]